MTDTPEPTEMELRVANVLRKFDGTQSEDLLLMAARAAIRAMREPTPYMIVVGCDTPIGHAWGSGGEYTTCPEVTWQAMIDAASPERVSK